MQRVGRIAVWLTCAGLVAVFGFALRGSVDLLPAPAVSMSSAALPLDDAAQLLAPFAIIVESQCVDLREETARAGLRADPLGARAWAGARRPGRDLQELPLRRRGSVRTGEPGLALRGLHHRRGAALGGPLAARAARPLRARGAPDAQLLRLGRGDPALRRGRAARAARREDRDHVREAVAGLGPDYYSSLAWQYERSNDAAHAREFYRKALERNPDDAYSREALERLAAGEG